MPSDNQTPEQAARDKIDEQLSNAGWIVQDNKKIDFSAGLGIAVREYQTSVGPADYILFVDKKPVGVIEAKSEDWGQRITTVEEQSGSYAVANLKWVNNQDPLPFVYETTGVLTRFTDSRDPKPRSREVFNFPRPETIQDWLTQSASLRERLQGIPSLDPTGLRACQVNAIEKLEVSFKDDRPRALIQMATGSGKTYAAITSIYRLLKHADAKRILFLVDTKHLGEQAEQECMAYVPSDDNRKFTELYNVRRLKSSYVAKDSQVCISTIQRMYSLLKGEELDESVEESNPAEMVKPKKPVSVVYNDKIPPEFFDFIVIDECHRSIYNLWRQVLEYFDAYLIGLTATPDNRTYGFFKKNVVSEYTHEQAVADGVNVGNEIYVIDTKRTKHGGQLETGQQVEKRERLTRRKRWEIQDEDFTYGAQELDRAVVNPDQIRTVIRTFHDKLPEIFPGPRRSPEDTDICQDRQPRRRHHSDRARGIRRRQRVLQEGHLQNRRRPEICPRPVPQRLLPAHRCDRGYDRHGYRRQAARMPAFHARREESQLFRADEGPWHAHTRPRRSQESLALRCQWEDPLCDRGRRRRHKITQDCQPAAHHRTLRATQGPRYGCDDGCLR